MNYICRVVRLESPHLFAGGVPRSEEPLARGQYVLESQKQECRHPPTIEVFNDFLASETINDPLI